MRVVHHADGGVETFPETDDEKRLVEAGVEACVRAIQDEIDNAEEHRQIGSDPGDFRDIGLEEAHEAMEEASADKEQIGDLINAVCCDPRVIKALDNLMDAIR